MTSKIPTRSEIPESDTWDLSHLFQTEEAYREAFAQLGELSPKIAEYRAGLGESVENLFACLEFEKRLNQIAERLGHYASLKNAEDSSNNESLSRQAELTNLLTKVREVSSFIGPEIQQIPDEIFQRFLDDPILAPWKITLIKLRRYKPHTLSEREERLLTLGDPVIRGHSDVFSQLTNVDMKFGSLNVEGRELAALPKQLLLLPQPPGIEICAVKLFTSFTRSSMITNTALPRRSPPPFERMSSWPRSGIIRLPVKHLFFMTTSPWLSMTTSSRPFAKTFQFFTSTTNFAGKS